MPGIIGASNTAPIVITTAGHGLTTGNVVFIIDVYGNYAANGTWTVTVIDAFTFSLNGSTGNGDYFIPKRLPANLTGFRTPFTLIQGVSLTNALGGYFTTHLPTAISAVAPSGVVRDMTGNGVTPIVVTGTVHGLTTGDTVVIAGVLGNTNANGTHTVTVIDSITFSLNGTTGNGLLLSAGYWTTTISTSALILSQMIKITSTNHKAEFGNPCAIYGALGRSSLNGSYLMTATNDGGGYIIDTNTVMIQNNGLRAYFVGGATETLYDNYARGNGAYTSNSAHIVPLDIIPTLTIQTDNQIFSLTAGTIVTGEHGLQTGDLIALYGLGPTLPDQTWSVTVIDSLTFSLDHCATTITGAPLTKGLWVHQSVGLLSASNARPARIAISDVNIDDSTQGFQPDDRNILAIIGAVGNTAINGVFIPTYQDNQTCDLIGSEGNGTLTISGTVTSTFGIAQIINLTRSDGATYMVPWPVVYQTATPHGLPPFTGFDLLVPITISGLIGDTNLNGQFLAAAPDGDPVRFAVYKPVANPDMIAISNLNYNNGRVGIIPNPILKFTAASAASPIVLTLDRPHNLMPLLNFDYSTLQVDVIQNTNTDPVIGGTYQFVIVDSTHISLTGTDGDSLSGATGWARIIPVLDADAFDDVADYLTLSEITQQTVTVDSDINLLGVASDPTLATVLPITAATNATPIVITSAAHGLTNNADLQLNVNGVLGNTAANGTWPYNVLSDNTIGLVGSVGNGALIAGPSVTNITNLPVIIIIGATNASPIAITTSTAHGYSTNDSVLIQNVLGTDASNGVWQITVIDSTHFSLVNSNGNGDYLGGGTVVKPTASPIVVTGCSDTTPIVLTTGSNHNLSTGNQVLLRDFNLPSIDGPVYVTVLTATTFSINGSIAGGDFASGSATATVINAPAIALTAPSGTGVYGANKFEILADGAPVRYNVIDTEETVFEQGLGAYDALNNVIIRDNIDITSAGNDTPIEIDAVPLTVTGQISESVTTADQFIGLDLVANPGAIADFLVMEAMGDIGLVPNPTINDIAFWMKLFRDNTRIIVFLPQPGTVPAPTAYLVSVQSSAGQRMLRLAQTRAFGPAIVYEPYTPVIAQINGELPKIIRIPATLRGAPVTLLSRLTVSMKFASRAFIVLQAGIIVIDIVNNTANKFQLYQGRLQVKSVIARSNSAAEGASDILYFMPIYQDTPLQAKMTLMYKNSAPAFLNNIDISDFNLIDRDSNVPSINLNRPSQIPFSYTSGRLPNQNATAQGIPCDIFMYAPFGAVPNVVNAAIGPKLFYLNWFSATSRNNGLVGAARIGHDLVLADLSNNPIISGVTNITGHFLKSTPTGSDVAYIQNGNSGVDARTGLYMYVGTAIPINSSGYALNAPGYRLVWNYRNRMPYNDIKRVNEDFYPINREAGTSYLGTLKPNVGQWRHMYLDPTDGTNTLPSIRPFGGRVRTYIVGGIDALLKWNQNNPSIARNMLTGNGRADCVPVLFDREEITIPTGFTTNPGFNVIELYQALTTGVTSANDKNYGCTGGFPIFAYRPNTGYLHSGALATTDADSDVSFSDTKPVLFGFKGDC